MTEAEFLALYKQTLTDLEETVERALQDEATDIDYESGNDMLTIMFSNDSVAIISRQSAICQLWLAARSGGFHFEYDASKKAWLCTLDGQTLGSMLQQVCLEQGGVELVFP